VARLCTKDPAVAVQLIEEEAGVRRILRKRVVDREVVTEPDDVL
jgi:hypothetical protein